MYVHTYTYTYIHIYIYILRKPTNSTITCRGSVYCVIAPEDEKAYMFYLCVCVCVCVCMCVCGREGIHVLGVETRQERHRNEILKRQCPTSFTAQSHKTKQIQPF